MVKLPTRTKPPSGGGKGGGGSGGGGGGGSSTPAEPALISYAGTGFFGIRPGAFVLLMNDNSIGWCSLAHVYGTPGAYATWGPRRV